MTTNHVLESECEREMELEREEKQEVQPEVRIQLLAERPGFASHVLEPTTELAEMSGNKRRLISICFTGSYDETRCWLSLNRSGSEGDATRGNRRAV